MPSVGVGPCVRTGGNSALSNRVGRCRATGRGGHSWCKGSSCSCYQTYSDSRLPTGVQVLEVDFFSGTFLQCVPPFFAERHRWPAQDAWRFVQTGCELFARVNLLSDSAPRASAGGMLLGHHLYSWSQVWIVFSSRWHNMLRNLDVSRSACMCPPPCIHGACALHVELLEGSVYLSKRCKVVQIDLKPRGRFTLSFRSSTLVSHGLLAA